jgi:hypothetical protein
MCALSRGDDRRVARGGGLDRVLVFASSGFAVALMWESSEERPGRFVECGRVTLPRVRPPAPGHLGWKYQSRGHASNRGAVYDVEIIENVPLEALEARVAYSFSPQHLGLIRVTWASGRLVLTALDLSRPFAAEVYPDYDSRHDRLYKGLGFRVKV